MSEKGNIDYEASLANVYVDLFKTILQICGAWLLIWVAIIIATFSANALLNIIGFLFLLFAPFLAGGPIALKYFQTRSFAKIFEADYEVVTTTTYGDGRKTTSSDGGMESMAGNTVWAVIIAIFFIVVGLVVQLIRLIMQISKYIYYYTKVSTKPAFKHSGFLLIAVGVAVLIATPIVASIPVNIQRAAEEKRATAIAEMRYRIGGTVMARSHGNTETKLFEEADDKSTVLLTIPKGVHLTIIDKPVNYRSTLYYLPVEYEGTRGWIDSHYSFGSVGTGTVKEDIEFFGSTIRQGETVNIGGYTPPNRKANNPTRHDYYVEHNGNVGSLDADKIEVSPELKKALGVVR